MAIKRDDAGLLRQIRENTEMGMIALETLFPKVEDAPLGRYLNQKELQYSGIRDRAKREMLKEGEEGGRTGAVSELALRGAIPAETLFDTSASQRDLPAVEGDEPLRKCGTYKQRAGGGASSSGTEKHCGAEEVSLKAGASLRAIRKAALRAFRCSEKSPCRFLVH